MKRIIFTLLIVLVMMGVGFSQNNVIDINQPDMPFKSEMTFQQKSQISSFSIADRVREISFNENLGGLKNTHIGDFIELNLFSDKNYNSVIQKVSTDINGTKTIRTKLVDYRHAYAIIIVSGEFVYINVDIPELNEKYISRINPLDQTTCLLQLNNRNAGVLEGGVSLVPEGLPQIRTDELNPGTNTINPEINNVKGTFENNAKLGVNDPANIDVMIVYTPAAQTWAASEGGINVTIASAMEIANLASDDSNLGITYTLVYSGLVTYTEVDPSTDLSALRTDGDGIMDNVHTNRNTYSADMVVLFEQTDATGGLGYVLNSRYGREDLAFCLNRVQQVSWTYTMIHEMGHNSGASHHKDQLTQAGPTTWNDWPENGWSAGWRWIYGSTYYCDLMTYDGADDFADGNPSTRVGVFSDPGITDHGQPAGHATYGDNARTLRETKHYMAQYKDATTNLYCAAGSSVYGYTHLTNVQMGDINQTSSISSYTDFSFNSTDVTPGVATTLTITKSSTYSYEVLVWVDWNNDRDFVDAGELVYQSGASTTQVLSTDITPPLGTAEGEKRMRIRVHSTTSGPNATPCGDSERGEVEDYVLNVLPSTPTYNITFYVSDGTNPISSANVVCDGASQSTNGLGQTVFTGKTNGTYNYNITKTGYSPASGTVTVSGSNTLKEVVLTVPTYSITFNVTDGTDPIEGATVVCDGVSQTTNSLGGTVFTGKVNGTYNYSISKVGYIESSGSVLVNGGNVLQNVSLNPETPETYTVTFNVKYGTTPVSLVSVTFNGNTVNTNSWGNSVFTNVSNSNYNYTISKEGYNTQTGTLNISSDTTKNIVLVLKNTTELTTASCGSYHSDLNDWISANKIINASLYEFEFINSAGGTPQYRQVAFYGTRLINVPGINYNVTYNVRVRAQVDGVWTDFGSTCQIITGPKLTQLTTASCGSNHSNLNDWISANVLTGYDRYEFEFTDVEGGDPVYRQVAFYGTKLISVPGISHNKTYNVRARARLYGVWQEFGPICTVSTNLTKSLENEIPTYVNAYPNPFVNSFTLSIQGNPDNVYELCLYDITGRILENKKVYANEEVSLGETLNKGIYIVVINGYEFQKTIKMIKSE